MKLVTASARTETGECSARVSRKNPFLRDLLFPFYSIEQFVTLCLLCAVAYVVSTLFKPDIAVALVGWAGGSISLTTVAPARLHFQVSQFPQFVDILERMKFVREPDEKTWRYKWRWIVWRNSVLVIERHEHVVVVNGPMSTLAFIVRLMRRRCTAK
ncbi:MAG: hypothetical protein KGJ79_18755 [Alphaproteobacteria bacterium]|nr:hypothetical protein [Alphaproteobacteria bacterium]MDE2113177.1 hypothetical protein [Alphaproteobacteria bacterium]MDE2493273.1 hypothetical protein [Alphaproteobacteria bacterium]